MTTRLRLLRAQRLLKVQEQMRGLAERDLAANRAQVARVEADRAAMLSTLAGETMHGLFLDAAARRPPADTNSQSRPSPRLPPTRDARPTHPFARRRGPPRRRAAPEGRKNPPTGALPERAPTRGLRAPRAANKRV